MKGHQPSQELHVGFKEATETGLEPQSEDGHTFLRV